jgi:hypothetical protein
MLKDVFAIRDISEIVSERLATLCRILHPLDTLFPELDNGVSGICDGATMGSYGDSRFPQWHHMFPCGSNLPTSQTFS